MMTYANVHCTPIYYIWCDSLNMVINNKYTILVLKKDWKTELKINKNILKSSINSFNFYLIALYLILFIFLAFLMFGLKPKEIEKKKEE